jgi:hypothetical protein
LNDTITVGRLAKLAGVSSKTINEYIDALLPLVVSMHERDSQPPR